MNQTTIPIILSQPEAEDMPEYVEQVMLCIAIFFAQQHTDHIGVFLSILFPPLLELVTYSDAHTDNYEQAEKMQRVFNQVEQNHPYRFDIQQVDNAYDNYDEILQEYIVQEISFSDDPIVVDSFYSFETHPQGRQELYNLFTTGRLLELLGTKLKRIIGNSISTAVGNSEIEVVNERGDIIDNNHIDILFSAIAGKPRIKITDRRQGGIEGFLRNMKNL